MSEQASADSSSSSNAAPSTTAEPTSASASEGGEIDYKGLFAQHQEVVKQELADRDQKISKHGDTLERVRQALLGEDGKPAQDPIESQIEMANAEIDQYIQAAMEAERKGHPIPLTAKAAINGLKDRIAHLEYKRDTDKKIAAMEARQAQLADPGMRIDETAYSNMDSHLVASLNTIFGPTDEDTKSYQFEAISKRIVAEIKDLRQNEPQTWDRLRRDRNAQTKLVNHFVKQSIPPRARQIMEEDQIRRTPMPTAELMQAFREAQQKAKEDPKAARYASEIRQELLSRMLGKNMSGASQTRMSELF